MSRRRCWLRCGYRRACCERRAAQQRLHDQVNGLCPGLSAPAGHGRSSPGWRDRPGVPGLPDRLRRTSGPARSLQSRARGRVTDPRRPVLVATVEGLPAPALGRRCPRRPAGSQRRPLATAQRRPGRRRGRHDRLLARTDGQILTTLPGVKARPCRLLQRLHTAHRALPDRRTSLLGDRLGAGQLPVLDHRPARWHQPPGPARAPQRPHGHRLGAVAALPAVHRSRGASSEPVGCARCRSASRSRDTPAGSSSACSPAKTPSTNGVTVEHDTRSGGDGAIAMPHDGAT